MVVDTAPSKVLKSERGMQEIIDATVTVDVVVVEKVVDVVTTGTRLNRLLSRDTGKKKLPARC